MNLCFADIETFSPVPIKAGTWAYAEQAEVMVWTYAFGDGPVHVWDATDGSRMPSDLAAAIDNPEVMFVFHNGGMFDLVVLLKAAGIDIAVERLHDTLAQALAHGLPGSLGKLCDILGVPTDEAKDKRGRELIRLFCTPRPKNSTLRRATRETHPQQWAEFLEYAAADITSMRAVYRRMPAWNYQGTERSLWHLDQVINRRGIQLDLDLARAAIAAVDKEKARLKADMQEATDGLVSGPSKRDDLLAFILSEHGVDLPDMKADTLRRRAEDPELPDPVRLLLNIRLEATKTSTAKYQAMLDSASPDGRIRGTAQFCGASRTGRWAHRLMQPGNMPRPTAGFDEELQELGIDALKSGHAEIVGDVMQLTSNCIRGAIVAAPGRKLVVADLSNIEGRKLAWLAGEHWKLKAFRDFDAGVGFDLYVMAYARAFNLDPADVEKWMRQIGKVMELALGYEGGVAAFITFAAVYGMDLAKLADAVHRTARKDALARAYGVHEWTMKKGRNKAAAGLPQNIFVACEVLKHAWREAHHSTVLLWNAAKDGVTSAIQNPGVTFDIGQHLKARRDGAWLRVRLPSGRYLCYLQPKVADDGTISYMGVNQYTRQWARIKTYGGKIIENADQASSRDVLGHSMPLAEAAGYPIVLTVHDELLTEPEDSPAYNAAGLGEIMSTVPPWAKGLPLAAAGFEAYRYRKD
jgi:DNA polymerase